MNQTKALTTGSSVDFIKFLEDHPDFCSEASACSEPSCQYYPVPPISPESIAATLDLIEDAILSDQWKPEAKARFQEMADHLGAIPQNADVEARRP